MKYELKQNYNFVCSILNFCDSKASILPGWSKKKTKEILRRYFKMPNSELKYDYYCSEAGLEDLAEKYVSNPILQKRFPSYKSFVNYSRSYYATKKDEYYNNWRTTA